MKEDNDGYSYSFPALRGVQARKEYYVIMCPLRIAVLILRLHDEQDEIASELKAQRSINKSRIPSLVEYINENRENYVFSSLTASIGGKVSFKPHGNSEHARKMGVLSVPMDAPILINDGQHRRAAIEKAIANDPSLENETISIVFFIDAGLERSQQMFADLNRYSVRPTKSISILYDHRDPLARLCAELLEKVTVFKGMTETAKSTISNRSRKLFTLSSIYQASKKLLGKKEGEIVNDDESQIIVDFWNEVATYFPDWQNAVDKNISPSELRRDYIHAHGIALQALSISGAYILEKYPKSWKSKLKGLKGIDWSRSNAKEWEGRAMIGGRLSKAQNNVILTSNVLKKALKLPLTTNEEKVERLYQGK